MAGQARDQALLERSRELLFLLLGGFEPAGPQSFQRLLPQLGLRIDQRFGALKQIRRRVGLGGSKGRSAGSLRVDVETRAELTDAELLDFCESLGLLPVAREPVE